jgi:hypothetical protein
MGKVTFEARDFFEFTVPDDQRFDVIYDYTCVTAEWGCSCVLTLTRFFVAIPPQTRPNWGAQMCKYVQYTSFRRNPLTLL